jgi:ferredoxin
MGIPILALGRAQGKIVVADCMGCGRCVTECPKNSLAFHDVRSFLIPARRDRAWLRNWAAGKLARSRWHVMALVGLLVLVAAGSLWAHQAVGTAFELTTTLCETSCLAH